MEGNFKDYEESHRNIVGNHERIEKHRKTTLKTHSPKANEQHTNI